ncbi:MAG: cupredoxin domain-containing protein [Pseudomonadota bacterium]
MTWLLLICFSVPPLFSASVSGTVELRDSHVPAVRKRRDFSGVVISLKPALGAVNVRLQNARAAMLQKDKTFSPHVLPIVVGTVVAFPNEDPIFHNAFSSYSGQIFDTALYPPGSSRSVRFTREGIVRVFCNIHSSMSAVIVVLANPYFALTGRDGAFEISDVPPGEYRLDVFHERSTEATLRALRRRVVVERNTVVLPPIRISEAGYLPMPHKNKYGRQYPVDSGDHSIYPAARN